MKTVITSPDGLFFLASKRNKWSWTKDKSLANDFVSLEFANHAIKNSFAVPSFNTCLMSYKSIVINRI